MSTNYSALRSSLHSLKLTSQFTSTPVEHAKAYDSFFGDNKDKKPKIQHQKLSAVAYIGATSPDTKAVTSSSAPLKCRIEKAMMIR